MKNPDDEFDYEPPTNAKKDAVAEALPPVPSFDEPTPTEMLPLSTRESGPLGMALANVEARDAEIARLRRSVIELEAERDALRERVDKLLQMVAGLRTEREILAKRLRMMKGKGR